MEVINAVRDGDLESIRAWFNDNKEGVAANQLVSLGVSAAHWAASSERPDILEELLSRLPNELKDVRDASDGATPLHWAAQDGRTANIMCLLKFCANIFAVDSSGETALHYASMSGHLEAARVLVRAGGPKLAGILSEDGNTALHLATMNGHTRIIALLLTDGAANPNQPNKFGQSPLSIAQAKRDKELLAYFDPEKMILLELIANLREDQVQADARMKILVEEKELEIRKTANAYKRIQALEEELSSVSNQRNEALLRLATGEQMYAQQQEAMSRLQHELQQNAQRAHFMEEQLQKANIAAAQVGFQQSQPQPTYQNSFHNEYAQQRLIAARDSLASLQRMLDDVGMAIIDTKSHLNSVVDNIRV